MTDRSATPGAVRLVAVEPDLATHVIDLLDAADILAWPVDQGALTQVMIPANELQRASATLDLVLPGLLAEESGELLPPDEAAAGPGPLSGRLLRRSDWGPAQPQAPPVQDGRRVFDEIRLGGHLEDDPDYDWDDEGFEPPEPPPIPRGDTVSRFAWLGAIGGPILMTLSVLLQLPSEVAMVGLGGFVAGFGVLVARMPERARKDDGPDNGAVL